MVNASSSALRFIAAAVLAAALSGCATEKLWSRAPKAEAEKSAPEPDKAAEQHRKIVERFGLVAKTELSEYVTAVGTKVAAVSDCPAMAWKFTVLDTPEPQAFATERGHVYVNRGMIELMRSENDLAAVLAHEIAHNCTRDAQRSTTFDHIAGYGNLALIGAIGAIQPWALVPVVYFPEWAFLPAGAALGSHARQYEINADRHGAEYLRRAGYPPESMASEMEILGDLKEYEHDHSKPSRTHGRPHPRWMDRVYADHPDPDKRKAKLGHREALPVANDPAFLAHLDGLEVGSTKDSGIPSGGRLYFARWDISLEVPNGWKASTSPKYLWLSNESGSASMRLEKLDDAGDLCAALAPLVKGEQLTDVQRAGDGGVQSCTGVMRHSIRTPFGKVEGSYQVGIVAPESTPGVRFFYREFRRNVKNDEPSSLSIVRSIGSPGEDRPKAPVIRIRTVRQGDTFAALAKSARIPSAEAQLRLLNQRYPSGELEVGQLVKVVE